MKTLTSRMVLATVALVAIVALAIGLATTVAMRSYLTDKLDIEVRDALGRATHLPPQNALPGVSAGPTFDTDGPGLGFEVDSITVYYDADEAIGSVVKSAADGAVRQTLDSSTLDMLRAVPTDGKGHVAHLPGLGSYRVAATEVPGMTVVSGLPTEAVDQAVASLVWWEILLTLLGIVAAAAAGLFVVRRQLAPLREVAATAHEVAALPLSSGAVDLSARVPDPDERTEVGQVGAALNTLLAHVESSLAARHRSEQQVRQFVADASHELRTPLSTIRGYAELAQRTPSDATALVGSLSKVSSEADRMTSLVDDLLLLARLDAGRPLASEPVDVTRLLLEAVTDARVLAPDHQWRLELPEEPVEVIGDEQRLHQVITNLLTNARTHTPAGSTVTVRARHDEDGIGVEVADTGPGFPEDIAERAFERFTRADAARTAGGTGLGLSIVQAIVAAHGGSVGLANSPQGATITVRIPASQTTHSQA